MSSDRNKLREAREKVTIKEVAGHSCLLVLVLALLLPAVFLRGHATVPGYYLYEQPPWEKYKPADYIPVRNTPTSEYLLFFAKLNALSQEALRDGEWPLWNNLEFGGAPLLANYQSAVFSPYFLIHFAFGFFQGETVRMLAQLWVCGLAAYLCARGLRLRRGPSRLFSLALMLSGFCITWFYWREPAVMSFVPVVFLGTEFLAQQRYRKGFALLLVGAILILLAGHPENAFTASAGIGAYFILRNLLARKAFRHFARAGGLALGAWIVALLVCSVQIVPFLELVAHSAIMHAGGGHQLSESSGLPLQGMVSLIVPRFFGHSADGNFWNDAADNSNTLSYVYIGAAVVGCMTLLCAPGRLSSDRRAQVVALALSSLGGLLLSLRASAPLTGHLPIWPFWYAAFPLFGLPLLGAFGLNHWLNHPRRLSHLIAPALIALLPIGASLSLYQFHKSYVEMKGMAPYVLLQIALAGSLLAAVYLAASFSCNDRLRRLVPWLLAVCVVLDMLLAARNVLPTTPPQHLFPETKMTRMLQDLGHPVRVNEQSAGMLPGVFPFYGVETLGGWDAINPHRCMWEMLYKTGARHSEAPWNLCSLQYLLFRETDVSRSERHAQRLRYVASLDGLSLYESLSALPRAYLVNQIERVASTEALFVRLADPAFEPRDIVLTDARISSDSSLSVAARQAGSVLVEQWTSTTVTMSVQSQTDAFLVLLDNYYPGWKAWVDGTPAEVFPAYYAFRAVPVPAGESTVVMRYVPVSFRAGLFLSVASLLGLVLTSLPFLVGHRLRFRDLRSISS